MTFMGPFKHNQKQSHEFWWSQLLPCENSEAVHGHPGHNGPPPAQNRVKDLSEFQISSKMYLIILY